MAVGDAVDGRSRCGLLTIGGKSDSGPPKVARPHRWIGIRDRASGLRSRTTAERVGTPVAGMNSSCAYYCLRAQGWTTEG
jgi:hypothetical protein